MKKLTQWILLSLCMCVCGIGVSYASLANTQLQNLDSVGQRIVQHIWSYTQQGTNRSDLVERYYIIDDAAKTETRPVVQKRLLQVASLFRDTLDTMQEDTIIQARDFATRWSLQHVPSVGTGVIWEPDLDPLCQEHRVLMNDMAWAENMPLPLLIATREMESSCRFAYPANGDGPFQILSKNTTGTMNEVLMVNEIQDRADFSRGKRDWYARANIASGHSIQLSYTGWNLTGIVYHGALYNSLSGGNIRGEIAPTNPDYVWGRYDMEHADAVKDGLLVNMLHMIADW